MQMEAQGPYYAQDGTVEQGQKYIVSFFFGGGTVMGWSNVESRIKLDSLIKGVDVWCAKQSLAQLAK